MEPAFNFAKLIPLIIPIILLQIGLQIYALIDLSRQPKVRGGNKWIWVAVILLLEIFGPIIYFLFAKKDE
jgi:hypothetical protein